MDYSSTVSSTMFAICSCIFLFALADIIYNYVKHSARMLDFRLKCRKRKLKKVYSKYPEVEEAINNASALYEKVVNYFNWYLKKLYQKENLLRDKLPYSTPNESVEIYKQLNKIEGKKKEYIQEYYDMRNEVRVAFHKIYNLTCSHESVLDDKSANIWEKSGMAEYVSETYLDFINFNNIYESLSADKIWYIDSWFLE